jgi:hypothetical protein
MLITWEPSRRGGSAARIATIRMTATTPEGSLLFSGDVGPTQPAGPVQPVRTDRASFAAPPGRVQLDMALVAEDGQVLDNEARDVDVPDLRTPAKVLVTTEILRARSAREFRALSGDRDAAPAPGREFSRTERLLIRVPAYDPAGRGPTVRVKLLNRWGQTLRDVAPMPDVPAPPQFDLPLAPFAPGEYILEITASGGAGETKEAIPIKLTQ